VSLSEISLILFVIKYFLENVQILFHNRLSAQPFQNDIIAGLEPISHWNKART